MQSESNETMAADRICVPINAIRGLTYLFSDKIIVMRVRYFDNRSTASDVTMIKKSF